MKETKTNAMRILDKLNIPYEFVIHQVDEFKNGLETANFLNVSFDIVYKTIVTISQSKKYYVFCLPVNENLNLKKCAKIVYEKSLELLDLKDLLSVTGYVRGGCSPIGMKKNYPVIFDENVLNKEKIYLSAGRIDTKLFINVKDLINVTNAKTGQII